MQAGFIIAGVVRRLGKRKNRIVALDPRKLDPEVPQAWFAARRLQPLGLIVLYDNGFKYAFHETLTEPEGDELRFLQLHLEESLMDCVDEEGGIKDDEAFQRALNDFYREELEPFFEDRPLIDL